MKLTFGRKPAAPEAPRAIDHGDPEGWTVIPSSSAPPGYEGSYLVGYGSDWDEFSDFASAWSAHVIRGCTRYASRLLWRVPVAEKETE